MTKFSDRTYDTYSVDGIGIDVEIEVETDHTNYDERGWELFHRLREAVSDELEAIKEEADADE